jgi:Xaa-Pro aminopeptidase
MEGIHEHASKHNNNLKQHLVVIPSAAKVYMTEKIPYVFRQNTDFLYLSGCLEPDSALVLTGMRGDDHVSTLFVRKRDTHSELWDGPRTGVEGAPALFGVDQAYALTDLEPFIASFTRSHRSFILWYDFMNPLQPDVHRILREFLGGTWNKVCVFDSAVLYFVTEATTLTHSLTHSLTPSLHSTEYYLKN